MCVCDVEAEGCGFKGESRELEQEAEFEIPCGEKPRKKQGNTEYKVMELSSGGAGTQGVSPVPRPRAAALSADGEAGEAG